MSVCACLLLFLCAEKSSSTVGKILLLKLPTHLPHPTRVVDVRAVGSEDQHQCYRGFPSIPLSSVSSEVQRTLMRVITVRGQSSHSDSLLCAVDTVCSLNSLTLCRDCVSKP